MSWQRCAVWYALTLVVAAAWAGGADARALCPPRCYCDDSLLMASCADAALDVVPIQLNPEAEHINLTHNRIVNVHFTFSFYARLRTLDLSHNAIETLGSRNFESNDRLLYLNLSYNDIEVLDKHAFTGLGNLLLLNLKNNKLTAISALAFRDLQKLELLDLSYNSLLSLEEDTFKFLTGMITLNLNNNQFLDIPSDNLILANNLEHLSLSNNLIIAIKEEAFVGMRKLRALYLDNNILSRLDHSSFDGLSYLYHLDLSNNNLTTVPTSALSKLSSLSHLSLSGNIFTLIVAVSFQSLFRLRNLHLSGLEQLKHIDARAFVDNINLEYIWLNDNIQVETIPTRIFHGNPRLTHVSVKNNALTTLDSSHFPLDQLISLQIAGNPLICNCSLMWLWQLAQDLNIKNSVYNYTEYQTKLLIDFNEISCSEPENLQNVLLLNVPESEIRCTVGWVTITTIVLTISLIVSVSVSILYYIGILKKCKRQDTKCVIANSDLTSDLPKLGNGLIYGTGHRRSADSKVELDRYLVIGQPLRHNFNSIGNQWNHPDKSVYQDDHMENMYQQFGYETIPHHKTLEKPHIVYV